MKMWRRKVKKWSKWRKSRMGKRKKRKKQKKFLFSHGEDRVKILVRDLSINHFSLNTYKKYDEIKTRIKSS